LEDPRKEHAISLGGRKGNEKSLGLGNETTFSGGSGGEERRAVSLLGFNKGRGRPVRRALILWGVWGGTKRQNKQKPLFEAKEGKGTLKRRALSKGKLVFLT